MNNECYIEQPMVSTHFVPKVIAKITLCGAFVMEIREGIDWNPPTPEQIKNLKEMLNIDVEFMK